MPLRVADRAQRTLAMVARRHHFERPRDPPRNYPCAANFESLRGRSPFAEYPENPAAGGDSRRIVQEHAPFESRLTRPSERYADPKRARRFEPRRRFFRTNGTRGAHLANQLFRLIMHGAKADLQNKHTLHLLLMPTSNVFDVSLYLDTIWQKLFEV